MDPTQGAGELPIQSSRYRKVVVKALVRRGRLRTGSESLRGGIDVARRVLSPRLDVAPGFLTYRTRLSGPQARLLFVNSVSLLPGTLAADLQDDRLTIHALDSDAEFAEDLARLETAVARVYREAL